jgi:hypothetical protein
MLVERGLGSGQVHPIGHVVVVREAAEEFEIFAGGAQLVRSDGPQDHLVIEGLLVFLKPLEGRVLIDLGVNDLLEFHLAELENLAAKHEPGIDAQRRRRLDPGSLA